MYILYNYGSLKLKCKRVAEHAGGKKYASTYFSLSVDVYGLFFFADRNTEAGGGRLTTDHRYRHTKAPQTVQLNGNTNSMGS